MAYDEDLADRIRQLVGAGKDVSEKKMFGGLAFLINGNMSVSASGQGGLLLRADPDQSDALVKRGAERAVMQGRTMNGWLRVDASKVKTDKQLREWVAVGIDYARSLPPK